jgi:uncharacterized repeat protein (TIGR04076 family)
MFKVKVTVVGFAGDVKKYPCHFNYKVGDEIIWTGAEMKGRICPAVLAPLSAKITEIYKAGPRYLENAFYYPFWYAPVSEYDPSLKKVDGIGFRNVLKTIDEPQYHMANLRPTNSYLWPPHPERTIGRGAVVQCGDLRTAATFKLEAIDLADDGDSVTYFRRMMGILAKVAAKPGIAIDKLLTLYSKHEIEDIYPALSQIMVEILVEELALMSYLEVKNKKLLVTEKGEAKLKAFIKSLPAVDKEALNL